MVTSGVDGKPNVMTIGRRTMYSFLPFDSLRFVDSLLEAGCSKVQFQGTHQVEDPVVFYLCFSDELNNARGGVLIPTGTYAIRVESKK